MFRTRHGTVAIVSLALGACFGGPPAEPDADQLQTAIMRGTAETGPLDEYTTLALFEKQSCDLIDNTTYDCLISFELQSRLGKQQLTLVGTFTYSDATWQLMDLKMPDS